MKFLKYLSAVTLMVCFMFLLVPMEAKATGTTFTVSVNVAPVGEDERNIDMVFKVLGEGSDQVYVGDGSTAAIDKNLAGEIAIPGSVIYDNKTYTIKEIGDYAFANCTALTGITIPNTVVEFGAHAFNGCINLPSITIPDSVETISNNAFQHCSALLSITIPASVTSIGSFAFYGCTSLTDIEVDSNNIIYESQDGVLFNKAMKDLIMFPFGKKIEHYTIPVGVELIRANSFEECKGITNITFPDSLKTIEPQAFDEATGLRSINMGTGLETIGDSAFSGCTALTSITIGETVTKIGENAFVGCNALEKIEVASGHTSYKSDEGVLIDKKTQTLLQFPLGKKISHYTIPNDVTTIATYAFSESNLTSITIGENVTSITYNAFFACFALEKIEVNPGNSTYKSDEGVLIDKKTQTLIQFPIGKKVTDYTIPNDVTSIGDYAFFVCDKLTSITIGDNVTSIGNNAFFLCDKLTSITIGDNVTSIGFNAFGSCDELSAVYFKGDYHAAMNDGVNSIPHTAIIGYMPGANGWGANYNPVWLLTTDLQNITSSPNPNAIAIPEGIFIPVTTGTNMAIDDYSITFIAETGYILPTDMEITIGGNPISEGYTFDGKTGVLTINNTAITGNVNIKAAGAMPPPPAIKNPEPAPTPGTPELPTVDSSTGTITEQIELKPQTEGNTAKAELEQQELDNALGDLLASAESTQTAPQLELDIEVSTDTENLEITLPAQSLDSLAQTEGATLTVKSDIGMVNFDQTAIQTIIGNPTEEGKPIAEDIVITIAKADPSDLTPSQQAQVGDSPVYSLEAMRDGIAVYDFEGGMATISLPYQPTAEELGKKVVVFYIDANGYLHRKVASYDAQTGMITFTTYRFSEYTIMFEDMLPTERFSDLDADQWYTPYIEFAYDNKLMQGITEDQFAPNATASRAMLWTVLARIEGVELEEGSDPWYAAAQAWAIEAGISDGADAEGTISREQFVTMLYRLEGEPQVSGELQFKDAGQVSDYAQNAIRWALEAGVIAGYEDDSIKPQGKATRAELATMLMRWLS